jgi:predicted RNase H-like nuclease
MGFPSLGSFDRGVVNVAADCGGHKAHGAADMACCARVRIAGIDLAWGERRPDGVCSLDVDRRGARVVDVGLVHGDDALLQWLDAHVGGGGALLMIDAPIVCPNPTGSRPVDRLTHVHFGRMKCGCYPANSTKCPRPIRLARRLRGQGYAVGWALDASAPRLLVEVYPHPAMVRLFGLRERVPYKKGPVQARRRQFRRLQRLIRACLERHFPRLRTGDAVGRLLAAPWKKDVEDQVDGFFCALIGYWHWLHRGARSQVLGDRKHGFILFPAP